MFTFFNNVMGAVKYRKSIQDSNSSPQPIRVRAPSRGGLGLGIGISSSRDNLLRAFPQTSVSPFPVPPVIPPVRPFPFTSLEKVGTYKITPDGISFSEPIVGTTSEGGLVFSPPVNLLSRVVTGVSVGSVLMARFGRSSPERRIGLEDATMSGSRIKCIRSTQEVYFDAIDLIYLKKACAMALLLGFMIWWIKMPDFANLLPAQTLDPNWVNDVKETTSGVCETVRMGDACACPDKRHSIAADILYKEFQPLKDKFDPLHLHLAEREVRNLQVSTLSFMLVFAAGLILTSDKLLELAFQIKDLV
jgi:hypothetical protein